MDISKFLAKVLGIYFIIVSLAVLINPFQFASNVYTLINNMPVMFVTGFFTLILGILMVVSHNIWTWSWRLIITIIAWITLLKGASIILYPQAIDRFSMMFIQNNSFTYIAGGIDLALGLLLCYFGFRSRW